RHVVPRGNRRPRQLSAGPARHQRRSHHRVAKRLAPDMGGQGWLTERFEENRPRLRGVAYRMLGSLSEAEDAVQEAWMRLNRIDTATVENLNGWLTPVLSRVCLDFLRSRRSRGEEPIAAQFIEPSVASGAGVDPE